MYDGLTMERICGLVKERLHFVKEIWEQVHFFFEAPTQYDEKAVAKRWKPETPAIMNELINIIGEMEVFNVESMENTIPEWITSHQYHSGNTYNSIRICLVGEAKGPHLYDIMEIIGRDETVKRIRKALSVIK